MINQVSLLQIQRNWLQISDPTDIMTFCSEVIKDQKKMVRSVHDNILKSLAKQKAANVFRPPVVIALFFIAQVDQYRGGKEAIFMAILGLVIKKSGGMGTS
jgi:Asp-tRNA(Asn)/Glu-tRNA(Gln) amidotransferase B subunit